jgi:hypothetical protein
MNLQLDLLKYQDVLLIRRQPGKMLETTTKEGKKLLLKQGESTTTIFDPIRKKYFVKTPEELVRQLLIQFLIREKNYPVNCLIVERSLTFNRLKKRFDLVATDEMGQPALLVECKAPNVPLTEATFRQIAIYNMPLQVPCLLLTNGDTSFCCQFDPAANTFIFLPDLPNYPSLLSK